MSFHWTLTGGSCDSGTTSMRTWYPNISGARSASRMDLHVQPWWRNRHLRSVDLLRVPGVETRLFAWTTGSYQL
jgi:hypothetical protein